MKKLSISTLVIFVCMLIATFSLPLAHGVNKQIFYEVTKVIDGDTIQVKIGSKKEKVRLIGIDAPETVFTSKPVACFGKEASQKAKEMLLGQKVRLEADAMNSDKDKFNRLLRYVYLQDGTFINEYMVQEGYAYTYLKFPFQYKEQFKQAQRTASNFAKGLWNICKRKTKSKTTSNQPPVVVPAPQLTNNRDCVIKGNINSNGEKIYHIFGGAYYSRTDIDESKGERWFCSEAEAVAAGWRKSQQ